MHIEELQKEEAGIEEEEQILSPGAEKLGLIDAKRAVIGVGARVLFYPTLLYNVIRNKIQAEFRWWDEVDQFLLLGAVPFPSDVPCLKQLGVCGVITLNEPYETLVPTSLYLAHGIEHLVIPTRDYYFAPSLGNICRAVDFIRRNASSGKTTYVHCKAGRGRSTTIVLCYLVRYRQMTPIEAYKYVRLSRPRVLLASPQWQAVQEYHRLNMMGTLMSSRLNFPVVKPTPFITTTNTGTLVTFDENSFVMVSKDDLDGYESDCRSGRIWSELSIVYGVQFAGQAALTSLSYLWIRCDARKGPAVVPKNKLAGDCCSLEADQLGIGHRCMVSGLVVKL